jgi:hypothetical protein
MFVISIVDSIISLNFMFSFLAIPEGLFWGAIGNTTSCEASGFFFTLLSSQSYFNAGLALYYYLIIVRSSRQEYLNKRVEPFIHATSLLLPLCFAIWILTTDSYNPLYYNGGWCSVYEYPAGCSRVGSNVKCTRGSMAKLIGTIYLFCFTLSPFMAYMLAMTSILCYVRGRRISLRPSSTFDQFKETIIQAILYIASFIVPYTFTILALFVTSEDPLSRFIFASFLKLILPLSGLFNVIIYIRPRYVILRYSRGQNVPSFTLLREIIMGSRDVNNDTLLIDDDFAPELTLDEQNHSTRRH